MIIDIFPTQIICFHFSKHTEYVFDDPGKIDHIPSDWSCSINSTFPRITDNDPLVSPGVRDRLIIDIKNACNDELTKEGLYYCEMLTFWYNMYHEGQYQERHDHMSADRPVFLSGVYYNRNPTPTTFYPISTHYRSIRYNGIEKSGIKESMYDRYHFTPKEGEIILFPPYLEHEVLNVDDKNGRLTFSFNLGLSRIR